MSIQAPFKRLILRAVLRSVSPMVIRVLAVPDSLLLHEFDAVFRALLGWDNIGFLFRVHGQEFNSFRRATRSRTLREFQLRPTETFRYTCGAIDLWEWEVRRLDEDPGSVGADAPLCLGGRGAAPPQYCGGPTGYRLMLKRQRMGEAMCTPVQMEAVVGLVRSLVASIFTVGPQSGKPAFWWWAARYVAVAARSASVRLGEPLLTALKLRRRPTT